MGLTLKQQYIFYLEPDNKCNGAYHYKAMNKERMIELINKFIIPLERSNGYLSAQQAKRCYEVKRELIKAINKEKGHG